MTQPEQTADIGQGRRVPGGVAGGVEGGVEGGVKGGVVGGELGGVEGGTLGGTVGGIPGGVPEAEPEPPKGPVRVGGQIQAPKKLKHIDPEYTELARARPREQVSIILESRGQPRRGA